MSYNNKKLISQSELHDIMFACIKPKLDKCKEAGGGWWDESNNVILCWNLHRNGIDGEDHYYFIRAYEFFHREWTIHTDGYGDKNNNIKIYPNNVEFVEDSKFDYFDKELMHCLYKKIKEVVEGDF